jgi:hypothetical protein
LLKDTGQTKTLQSPLPAFDKCLHDYLNAKFIELYSLARLALRQLKYKTDFSSAWQRTVEIER